MQCVLNLGVKVYRHIWAIQKMAEDMDDFHHFETLAARSAKAYSVWILFLGA
jgi:hypothetical protein